MYFSNRNNPARRSRDVCSQDDEIGLIYTRDKFGCLKAPRGYGLKFGDKSYLKEIQPIAASCSSEDLDGKISPCSLYSISLDFVAKNISMVESLYGFPDIVGKDLFDRVHMNEGFTHSWSDNFQLFNDAYGSLVLDKLNLNGQCLAISEVEYMKSFSCLSELDLSHCRMGSNHELMLHLSKMSSLTKLCFKDNCLNNNDIKLFTLPLRVTKVGPLNLELLDLSCNPGISQHAMRYLACFQSLVGLNLTGTSVLATDIEKTAMLIKMVPNSKFTGFNDLNQMQTEGWAASVIKDWLLELNTAKKPPKKCTTSSKAQSFYTQKKKLNLLQEKNSELCKTSIKKLPLIILTRPTGSKIEGGKHKSEQLNGNNKWKNGKRELDNEKRNNGSARLKRKQLWDDDMLMADNELLQSYMNNTKTVNEKKKPRLSLSDLLT